MTDIWNVPRKAEFVEARATTRAAQVTKKTQADTNKPLSNLVLRFHHGGFLQSKINSIKSDTDFEKMTRIFTNTQNAPFGSPKDIFWDSENVFTQSDDRMTLSVLIIILPNPKSLIW